MNQRIGENRIYAGFLDYLSGEYGNVYYNLGKYAIGNPRTILTWHLWDNTAAHIPRNCGFDRRKARAEFLQDEAYDIPNQQRYDTADKASQDSQVDWLQGKTQRAEMGENDLPVNHPLYRSAYTGNRPVLGQGISASANLVREIRYGHQARLPTFLPAYNHWSVAIEFDIWDRRNYEFLPLMVASQEPCHTYHTQPVYAQHIAHESYHVAHWLASKKSHNFYDNMTFAVPLVCHFDAHMAYHRMHMVVYHLTVGPDLYSKHHNIFDLCDFLEEETSFDTVHMGVQLSYVVLDSHILSNRMD